MKDHFLHVGTQPLVGTASIPIPFLPVPLEIAGRVDHLFSV